MSNKFTSTFEYKLIYIFRINDELHSGLLKIGEATLHTDKNYDQFAPNCRELNQAAKVRINSYTSTAGIIYELLHTEIAVRSVTKNGKTKLMAFSDHDVHRVLLRSGIERHYFDTEHKQNEWFKVELSTAVSAIKAVKENRTSLTASEVEEGFTPIDFRPEQKKRYATRLRNSKRATKCFGTPKCDLERR